MARTGGRCVAEGSAKIRQPHQSSGDPILLGGRTYKKSGTGDLIEPVFYVCDVCGALFAATSIPMSQPSER